MVHLTRALLILNLCRRSVMGDIFSRNTVITAEQALPGRSQPIDWIRHKHTMKHAVNGNKLQPPFPEGTEQAMFGMGCFWGAEKLFWKMTGVYSTQVGFSAGYTKNPTYREVCSGNTGHNEVVRIIYEPKKISYEELVKAFFENHIPTQGNRQGNDQGTQYRSGAYYYNDEQKKIIEEIKEIYQKELSKKGYGAITSEIKAAEEFYYAEDYHQQYLHKNKGGYCGMGGTKVSCPIGKKKSEL